MDVLARIKELMKQRNWTNYRLAKKTNKQVNQISDMFKRQTIPSIATLEGICDAFEITMSEFFAEGEEPTILSPKQREILWAYDSLGDSEKDLLRTYLFGLAKISLLPDGEAVAGNQEELKN